MLMGRDAGRAIPVETARVAWAASPKGTPAMRVRDLLQDLFVDDDFVGWFPVDGRRGVSPARLALVSVLQYAENLTDRQAARAVACRIDWKYALGMELTEPREMSGDGRGARGWLSLVPQPAGAGRPPAEKPTRLCPVCGGRLPAAARVSMVFCCAACRARHWRTVRRSVPGSRRRERAGRRCVRSAGWNGSRSWTGGRRRDSARRGAGLGHGVRLTRRRSGERLTPGVGL